MNKAIYILSAMLLSLNLYGQNVDDGRFHGATEATAEELESLVSSFEAYADSVRAEYERLERIFNQEHGLFADEVTRMWGDETLVESSKKSWVEYSEDRSSRTTVDFETGEVNVELLSDPGESEEEIRIRMEASIAALMTSRGKNIEFTSSVIPRTDLMDEPILQDLIDFSGYEVSEGSSAAAAAPAPVFGGNGAAPSPTVGQNRNLNLNRKQNTTQTPVSRTPAGESMAQKRMAMSKAVAAAAQPVVIEKKTETGSKNVVKITMKLVEDHIPKRAERFKTMISRYSEKFSVDQPLIYAIIEQESSFNPAAQSWVPAYGLMQLVPKSGGRDAYRYVHKKDVIPTAEFLFDPERNIELGTGYLKLLMSTTFSKVADNDCRMLCAIAAYNTGAGNVSRAIIGNTNISKAIPEINKMSYQQLFNHLKRHLPHAETQDYIQKVTDRMQKYK